MNWYALMIANLLFWFGNPFAHAAYTKNEAKKVLKTAETIRCLDKARLSVDLTTVSGKQTVAYDLEILRSTENRALVTFLAPKEEVGRKMLASKNIYWSTFPDSKKVVTVSRKEMIGNSAFALADIFQLDADKDYDPTIVAEETMGGKAVLKLKLKAKHDEAPYASIEYWVEKKDYFPVTAKFYSESGKLLKTMSVEERGKLGGRIRPSKVKMVDAVTKGKYSTWATNSMEGEDLPDSIFNKEYLQAK